MTDHDLRSHERRFRETGALEDEVAWLRARLRAGAVGQAGLRLAAWLGHPAAARITDVEPGLSVQADAGGWLGGLAPFGGEACLRVGLAAARLVVPSWEAGVLHAGVARGPGRLLDAVQAWLACPCERHRDQAFEDVETIGDELAEFMEDVGEERLWILNGPGLKPSAEYEREVAPQAESARRPKRIAFIASTGGASDDHLGLVLGDDGPTGQVAAVHLTFSVEHDPRWPSTSVSSLRSWARSCATYWPAAMPVAAAQAATWLLTPATFEPCPVFNASAPVAFAALLRPLGRVLEAVQAEVVPWALALV